MYNIQYTVYLLQVNTIEMCAAAALNLYTDVEIQGFALPKALSLSLDSSWLEDALDEAMRYGAKVGPKMHRSSVSQRFGMPNMRRST